MPSFVATRYPKYKGSHRRYLEVFTRPPPVLQLCQQIRNESLPLFYANNTLSARLASYSNDGVDGIKTWFKRLGEDSRHVRNLEFDAHLLNYNIIDRRSHHDKRVRIVLSIERDKVKFSVSQYQDMDSPHWVPAETCARALNELLYQCVPSRPRRARKRVSGLGADEWVFLLSKLSTLLQHFDHRNLQKWHRAVLAEHQQASSA
jgi:hypothetical protein